MDKLDMATSPCVCKLNPGKGVCSEALDSVLSWK